MPESTARSNVMEYVSEARQDDAGHQVVTQFGECKPLVLYWTTPVAAVEGAFKMKKLIVCSAVAMLAMMVTTASAENPYRIHPAAGPSLYAAPMTLGQAVPPAPAVDGTVPPMPHAAVAPQRVIVAQPAVALFHRVKYKDLDEMHPCAVPKIIAVKDPCARDHACGCCAPPACVYIKICVPPCACEEIDSNRSGTRIEYDYGKYEVDVRVKDGYIEVDYQD